jgi:hypothetical protein
MDLLKDAMGLILGIADRGQETEMPVDRIDPEGDGESLPSGDGRAKQPAHSPAPIVWEGTHGHCLPMVFLLFGGIRFGFGFVNRSGRMVRRRIHGIQLQLPGLGSVDHIVVGSGGHDYRVVGAHRMFFRSVEDKFRIPLFDPEKLIDLLMHLIADFLARLKAHEYQLAILPGKHHLPKIVVLESLFFDWAEKACHG